MTESRIVKERPRFMVGADPEFFVTDMKHQIMPACGLIGGKKGNPIKMGAHTFCLEDNVAVEVNIDPCKDGPTFSKVIEMARRDLEAMLSKKSLLLNSQSSHRFKEEQIDYVQGAQELGCSEDFDAFSSNPKKARPPFIAENLGYERYCGGHVHVSYPDSGIPHDVVVKFMALTLGMPFVNIDKQGGRRQKYGLPGLYRPQKYKGNYIGVEYRTLSNFWVFNHDYTWMIGEQVLSLVEWLTDKQDQAKQAFAEIPWREVHDSVLNEDRASAKDIMSYCKNTNGYIPFNIPVF